MSKKIRDAAWKEGGRENEEKKVEIETDVICKEDEKKNGKERGNYTN